MDYKELVEVYEELGKTTKRLKKTEILTNFLKKVSKDDLKNVICLLKGKVFPMNDSRKIGFSSRLMIKAISRASGESDSNIEKLLNKKGDLGKVAYEVLNKKSQATLFNKKLNIEHVIENIRKLSSLEGEGTVNNKIGLVTELLSNSNALEAKYIVGIVLENLRIGIADGLIRDSIARTFDVDVKIIEEKADLTGDYAEIALLAKEKRLEDVSLEVGRPVKCMLALLAESVENGFEALGKPAQFEIKLDGFRLQCHNDDGKITLFTRMMENVTKQFPDVVGYLKKHVKAKSYILDTEAVGYDRKNKRYLPFQAISQRIKRKYDVEDIARKFPVEVNVFDVMFLDGKNLMNKTLKDRRKVLEKIIKINNGEIILTEKLITDDNKKALDFFEKILKEGYEGVMIKNLNSLYKPGRYVNGWMKLKNILEPLDLVIVKAEHGEGKRAGWLTSYTVACNDKGKLLEVGKVSTGVKEKTEGLTYKEMTKLLKPLIESSKGKEVSVKAKIIIEVGYEEIQKSPTYSSGYALRFPRVLKYRTDKNVKDINSLKDVEKIYDMQRGKK